MADIKLKYLTQLPKLLLTILMYILTMNIKMDIYTANGDTEINRPLILFMHGGSFYGGDKTTADCVDFCESMAKRGYVTASLNYRLSNLVSFLSSQEEQYTAVLKAVADAKSAIRYFRKDFATGDTYGIDSNTIFIGGYSAGGSYRCPFSIY